MKTKLALLLFPLTALLVTLAGAARSKPSIAGDYVEVRSCDVYTGACVANSEMGLAGREGMMVWSVREGGWKGTKLDGLTVMAIVRTGDTLGDVRHQPLDGTAVLIVDSRASRSQHDALVDFAMNMAGSLVKTVAAVKTAPMESTMGTCASGSCAKVKAGSLVEISTRCLDLRDHLCGNEENFYPPLTEVVRSQSVFTELAAFRSRELNVTWEIAGKRSAYIGAFAR